MSSLDVSRCGLKVDDILALLPRLPELRFLAIQVRDRQRRAYEDIKRDAAAVEREKIDLIKAEIADSKFRETKRLESMAYARELQEQRRVQETRKTLEPFLMSRPERQMNAEMIGRLPSY